MNDEIKTATRKDTAMTETRPRVGPANSHLWHTPWRLAVIALLVLTAALLIFATRAEAGTYSVAQCTQSQHHPNTFQQAVGWANGSFFITGNCNGGPFDRNIYITPDGSTCCFHQGALAYTAPWGTLFTYAAVDATMEPSGGNWPQLYYENNDNTGFYLIHNGSSGGVEQLLQGGPDGAGRERFVLRLICTTGGSCGDTGYAGMTNIRLELTDYSAPAIGTVSGSLFSGAWLRGPGNAAFASPVDAGSGVRRTYLAINGTTVADQTLPCDSIGSNYHRTLTPCQAESNSEGLNGMPRSTSFTGVNLSQGQYPEGTNSVALCAQDLATTRGVPNESCHTVQLRIDNVAPTSPTPLNLSGSPGWNAVNDFDVSWSNPTQTGDVSPLSSTHYRIQGQAYDSGDVEVALTNQLNNLAVPAIGEYTLEVWAEDGAGNHNPASARTVQLKFDDTVPQPSEAFYNGWVRRNDFPLHGRVGASRRADRARQGSPAMRSRLTTTPRVIRVQRPPTRCRRARSTEVTNGGGINDLAEVIENYPEGAGHYIHVVPVSGAGVKAGQIKHTPMPVDRTDPVSRIQGVPDGWVNRNVSLTVNASDPLSGMVAERNFTPDPQPETVISVDGNETVDPDASVSTTISGEGVHQIAFFARDLAGNENDGAGPNNPPGTAIVRIDKTLPIVGFQNDESINDPTLIKAPTQDGLSGVVSGLIELQEARPRERGRRRFRGRRVAVAADRSGRRPSRGSGPG